MRASLRSVLLGAAALLGACASTTDIRADPEALDAAAQFQQIGQDAGRNGADPDVSRAYYNLSGAVARNGRISPITVVIDGTPLAFLATSQQLELDAGPACATPGAMCLTLPPVRSVVAWQKSDPRRVVQLTAVGAGTDVAQPTAAWLGVGVRQVASITYLDGSGGAYVGTGGTVRIPDPVTSDTPCRSERLPDGAVSAPELEQCTRAELTASADGTVAPPLFAVLGNTAAGTHTISIASQPVHGARIVFPDYVVTCPGCSGYPPYFLPPVDLRGGDLRTTIAAAATASLVTFEMRVTNPQTVPLALRFNSAQQYDFRVRRFDGTTVWLWSADKGFTQALTSRTLAPGETAVYTATWIPTVRGDLAVDGRLTSTSYAAGAAATFVVP